jgi:hypothetical protein
MYEPTDSIADKFECVNIFCARIERPDAKSIRAFGLLDIEHAVALRLDGF